MILSYIAGTLLLTTLAVVALLAQARQHRDAERHRMQEREAWVEERRELLNRIQAPHVVPHAPQYMEVPEQEPDEAYLVGTIVNDPEAYLRASESVNGDEH